MKVNYRLKNRQRSPYFKQTLVLITIFLLATIIIFFTRGIIISIVSPVWRVENVVTANFKNKLALLNSKRTLAEENARLKDKISSLELKMMDLNNVQILNNLPSESNNLNDGRVIVAGVLLQPPQTPYDIIIIDVGLEDSVTLGSSVALPEGPVIGIVSEVFPKSTKVTLLSANGNKTNAILERINAPITLVGSGGGNFRVALPHDVAVEIGDRIISSGLDSHLVAVVGKINVRPTDSFKEILAYSPANIFALRFVFVKQ